MTVQGHFPFLLCSLHSLWLLDTGEQESTVTSALKASVTTLSLHAWKKCNSCKWGARVVTARPAESPAHPSICQQTTHSFLPYGWLCCNVFALWDARPFWWESEQTCPSPPWFRSKAKAERCMTKGGEARKVKKRRKKSEWAHSETECVCLQGCRYQWYTCLQLQRWSSYKR